MATWQDYWKIVTPATRKETYNQPTAFMDDGQNINTAGYSAYSSVSWFSNLLKGSTARMMRYKQYDAMDSGDVSRALDIIAEEISNADKRTGLPFIIEYQTEEDQEIDDTVITTIRAALRHWSKFHKLNKRIFNIARTMVKYGDCFFRKTSDTALWEYIDPTRVIGIQIDNYGNVMNYHIRPSNFQSADRQKSRSGNIPGQESVEVTPAVAMLHFTLSDDMGDSAPFGLSVLQSAFKDYQKLSMLENSAVIYRIVRAPERRVFYVDVGNMPANRVKQYLEQIRNDMRQKRMPNTGNADQTDSTYNAEAIQEDFYFATTANGRGSKVETLPGGTTWEMPELDYFLNKVFRALRVPSSYMKGQDSATPGSAFNDGKTGVAYMEERIFANFVIRLQTAVEDVLDHEFKTYLQVTGINIDHDLFKLELPEPQNFALYRQAALDADLIGSFKSIEDIGYLSKRFILERFLGLTKDDIQMNEAMLKQERGIEDAKNVNDIRQMYDPVIIDDRKAPEIEPMGDEEPAGDMPEAPEKPAESPPSS